MKQVSNELAAHLAGEVTTLCSCWKLTRRDGTIMGFTDHDRDFTIGGLDYLAASGFNPTAIDSNATLGVDNLDVEGMLASGSITEADIQAGLYDFAQIEIFMVNYLDLTQGVLKLRRGYLGEVSISGRQFVAEVRGLTQRLAQTIGELYSPTCRASLGDSRCKVAMAGRIHTGSITSASGYQRFTDSARTEEAGAFISGKVTFTGGANAGLSMEVKEHGIGGVLVLALPMPYALAAGDGYTISEGCDKTLATCRERFDNVLNFRGEPEVPGLDKILETAGTRSDW